MDSFARKYLIVLSVVIVAVVGYILLNRDDRVDQLNEILARDAELIDYPYAFRVRRLEEDGIAIMGSPRSAEVPVMQFLRTAYPELRQTAVTDPAMMAAQAVLVEKQGRAQELIAGQDGIRSVRWEFDERWFNERGVFIP